MHEFGLAAEIVEAVVRTAEEAGAHQITAVHVVVSPDDHAGGPGFAEAFELAAAGTLASKAVLETTVGETGPVGAVLTAIDVLP
jgi:Zn finger protein HypA/HybF involved in hydrogenase expression